MAESKYDEEEAAAAALAGGGPVLRWERPATEGPVPEARGGHTACLVGTDLIIFGGHYYGGDGKFVYLGGTCVLDMTTNMWHKVRTGGDEPAGRYGHRGTALDGRIFVFGGRGANGALYKDMHCLDAETWCWSQVSSTTAGPSARFGHAQCLVGDKLVVFGGWDGRQAFNDLWVFDTGTSTWLMPRTAGQPPSPRHGCTMELLPDGRIVVFGGSAMGPKGPEYYSDVRELDTETMVWSRPRVTGDYPSGRYGHTSVMVGPYMLVYGGWCRRTKAQRAAATAAARGGGGGKGAGPDADGGHRAGHLSWLNCETMEWTQPGCENKVPMARHGHSAIIAGPHVVMWGGWGGNRALAELHDCQVLVPGLAEELVVEDSQEDLGDGLGGGGAHASEYVLPYADDLAPPSRDS